MWFLVCTDIVDLLEPHTSASAMDDWGHSKRSSLRIHENNGNIMIAGLKEVPVGSAADVMQTLRRGSLSRTTASTLMNEVSSRSHAIFTLTMVSSPKADKRDSGTYLVVGKQR